MDVISFKMDIFYPKNRINKRCGMPIKIPHELPAFKALEEENIFVISENRANRQDIRPLEISIVNLMPTKIATETQLLRLLGNTPLQVNITLVRTMGHQPKNTPVYHLEKFYKTFDEIKDRSYDGLIITGAPVEHLPFEEVDYWHELEQIMRFSSDHVYSTLFICWAAQAGLNYFYNIPKYPLGKKISGIFCHEVHEPYSRLFRGFDDKFLAPHSRNTEIRASDILKCKDLTLLASSTEAGPTIIENVDRQQIFVTGHFEYDRETLDFEYKRDLAKGIAPDIPYHYYPDNDPENIPLMNWRAHAHLFFSNWLNYYVYQETPFILSDIGGKTSEA